MTVIPEHHRRNIESGRAGPDGVMPNGPVITPADVIEASIALEVAFTRGPLTLEIDGFDIEVRCIAGPHKPIQNGMIQPGSWGYGKVELRR